MQQFVRRTIRVAHQFGSSFLDCRVKVRQRAAQLYAHDGGAFEVMYKAAGKILTAQLEALLAVTVLWALEKFVKGTGAPSL